MSPLFGGKDDGHDDVAAMDWELERLGALALPQLAAEVMIKGFGPHGPGGPGKPGTLEAPTPSAERVSLNAIARAVTPAFVGRGVGPEQQLRLGALLAEGLQVL